MLIVEALSCRCCLWRKTNIATNVAEVLDICLLGLPQCLILAETVSATRTRCLVHTKQRTPCCLSHHVHHSRSAIVDAIRSLQSSPMQSVDAGHVADASAIWWRDQSPLQRSVSCCSNGWRKPSVPMLTTAPEAEHKDFYWKQNVIEFASSVTHAPLYGYNPL